MLEVSADDLEWHRGSFAVKGDPSMAVTIEDIAMRAHGGGDLPDGLEGGLGAQVCYSPENLTYPFGAYICVVDIDPGTAVVKLRRFIAVNDCGTQINPMIVEGQVHGGLTDGLGIALMQMISFDETGNCLSGSFMDYLIPTALETPDWETAFTTTPSPHHPLGAKGIGECATVGSPPAIVNAVVDALTPLGIRHVDMPLTPLAGLGGHAGQPHPAIMTTFRTPDDVVQALDKADYIVDDGLATAQFLTHALRQPLLLEASPALARRRRPKHWRACSTHP